MMDELHWIILGIGVVCGGLLCTSIYLFLVMHKSLKSMMEYHCEFAGSHERLERWVKGINKDMNTIAAAVGDDRKQLRAHDIKVDGLVRRANEIMDIMERLGSTSEKPKETAAHDDQNTRA